jgi:tetratricopeptide (TPR) repeat protein
MSGTDQISAHLDRAWERLSRGDYEASERSAKLILAQNPKHPEALHLLGSLCAAQEKREEALELFHSAMQEDEGYLDPILACAELWLLQYQNPEKCLEHCEDILSFADEPEDIVEATLLKCEALFELGEKEEVLHLLRELPEVTDAPLLYRWGRCLIDIEQFTDAEQKLRAAISIDPTLSDAYYDLGKLLRDKGKEEDAFYFLWGSYSLDITGQREVAVMREWLPEVAEKTRANLPSGMRALLNGVPLLLAPRIGPELVAEGFDPRSLCFFAGQPAESAQKKPPQLERIFVYQMPLSLYAKTQSAVERELRTALLAEAAEFFQLSDRELADRGVSPEEL